MRDVLIASGITIELALLGALFKLGSMLGTINATLKGMAGDIHDAKNLAQNATTRLERHERSPHPARSSG